MRFTMNIAVAMRLRLHRKGVILLQRQVRVAVREARHLQTSPVPEALMVCRGAWQAVARCCACKSPYEATDHCGTAAALHDLVLHKPGLHVHASKLLYLTQSCVRNCRTHLLLLDQVDLGRVGSEVAVRPQQRLRARMRVGAGHDGQLQAHAFPAAALRLGLQRQDVLDVELYATPESRNAEGDKGCLVEDRAEPCGSE